MNKIWRTYIITTTSGEGRVWKIQAPSLAQAFHAARVQGGGSVTLTCKGTV